VEPATINAAAPVEETLAESATPAIETPADDPTEEKPADTSQMSDEEFEAFMKKAQAYYSGNSSEESANENIAEESGDDEDEGPTVYGADEN
jgi:hypothetical protein